MPTTENRMMKIIPQLWLTQLLTKRVQYILDVTMLSAAFLLAYMLRFDFLVPSEYRVRALTQLVLVVFIQFGALLMVGVYKFIWRYISVSEAQVYLKAVLLATIPVLLARLVLPESYELLQVPLSITIMNTALAFGGLLCLRVSRRIVYERYQKQQNIKAIAGNGWGGGSRVLLVGAGRAGVMTSREVLGRGDMNLDIRGFVDDDPRKHGAMINGIRVLGATADLPRLVKLERIDHVVISIAQASRADFGRILEICKQIPIKTRVVPGLYEIVQGSVEISRIRDVQIEDLLGREQVYLDEKSLKDFLQDKVVMVTGAGGSIKSELARQVARHAPSSLILVERSEFALYNIDREMREKHPGVNHLAMLADLGDNVRMRRIFREHRPDVVLHAAAHKHVPMMEFNCTEAIKNNVLVTKQVGELAGEFGVKGFVLISTDKAVRPTSVMGASKRLAELVVQDLNDKYSTRYVAVRFGNVIGSTGSVIPLFREQILKGGPVTVTHPDMVRYFMTIPEAAQLVLQAGAIGDGGEILVLDMGEPVRIVNLANDLITLSGLRPNEDIDIVFTGAREGEKLFEELGMTNEKMIRTWHPKIFVGRISGYPSDLVHEALTRLAELLKFEREDEIRRYLNELLPEANIRCEVKLDYEEAVS
jgi:FlaA1/EpsC-like NDP-sugar epimerase